MDIEDVVYVYNRILFSREKEGNPAIGHAQMDLEAIMLSEECRKSGEGASKPTSATPPPSGGT